MTHRRVVVTGLGFITSIGLDRAAVLASLRLGRHGIHPVTFAGNEHLTVKVAGLIPAFDLESYAWRDWTWPSDRYPIPRETIRGMAPQGVYALCATEQALADASLAHADVQDGATGLFCASGGSSFMMHHHWAQMHASQFERGNPLCVVSSISGTLNFNLAAHFGIRGGVAGFVSACASSSHALGYASDEIRLGRHDRIIVVGAEDINADTIVPFSYMRALSASADPATASRPFDTGRDGFVGSGGAVAMIIEAEEVALARGARSYAELLGWGQSADGHSIAQPHPEGAGLAVAMQRALRDAAVAPTAIDYINAHATSTPLGDRAEALALRAVFEPAGARPRVSSTKGLTGHPLSMAGVMEAGFCCLALAENFIPGNAHLVQVDPAAEGLDLPVASLDAEPQIVLNNSSGFGGSNVCHVLRRVPDQRG